MRILLNISRRWHRRHIFIFVEEEVDKRSKMYKTVKNNGKIVEFSAQSEELLTRWILTRIKKKKEKTSPDP